MPPTHQPLQLQSRLTHLLNSFHHLASTAPSIAAYLGHIAQNLSFTQSPPQTSSKRIHRQPNQNNNNAILSSCGACGSPFVPGWTVSVSLERKSIASAGGDENEQVRRRRKSKRRRAEWGKKGEKECAGGGGGGGGGGRDRGVGEEGERRRMEVRKMMAYECRRCGRVTRVPVPRDVAREGEGGGLRRRGLGTRGGGGGGGGGGVGGNGVESTAARVTRRGDKLDSGPQDVGYAAVASASDSLVRESASAAKRRREKARKQGGLKGMLEKSRREAEGGGKGGNGASLDLMDFMQCV